MPEVLSTIATLLLPVRAQLGLLTKTTPANVDAEIARLVTLASDGVFERPCFRYAHWDDTALHENLERIADALPATEPALRRRVEELRKEAELTRLVGTPQFGAVADARFACAAAARLAADKLATEWMTHSGSGSNQDATIRTDSAETGSLLSQMSIAVRKHSPFHRVITREGMTALAATGDDCVYIARDRQLSEESARRIVVHEVWGHVIPRVRAALAKDEVGRLGTFRGEDTQEGYAIFCEERENALTGLRKRELAERHLACIWMGEGAAFPEVVERLVRAHDAPADRAVRVASRTFRGSSGIHRGLGRERVYLPYYLDVREHLLAHPEDEARLTLGQRSLDELTPVPTSY